jgi:hypothetical protein
MDDVAEFPPFTPGMRAAIRECRFKTCDQAHTRVMVYDADKARVEATGLTVFAYRPAPWSEPERWDYEGRSGDARVVEYVAKLTGRDAA